MRLNPLHPNSKDRAYNDCRYSVFVKITVSILAGGLTLLTSKIGINTIFEFTSIDIPYSFLFPIVVSLAFGWRYGLLASLTGAAYIPFFLWPEDGFANIVTALLYTAYFTATGTVNLVDTSRGHKPVIVRMTLIWALFSVIYVTVLLGTFNALLSLNGIYWSTNTITQVDVKIIWFFAIKDLISLAIFTVLADVLLRIIPVRNWLGLQVDASMNLNLRILLITMMSAGLVWLSLIGLSMALIPQTDIHEGHYILGLYVILASGFIASRAIIYFIEKQNESLEKLKTSEYFFEETQRSGNIGSFEINMTTHEWESSDVLDAIFGIDKSYQRNLENWLKIIHPADRSKIEQVINAIGVGDEKFNIEFRIKRVSDKETRWVHGVGAWINPKLDNEAHLIGTIQDITDKKEIEEKLLTSENKLKALFESLTEMVVLHEVVFNDQCEAVNYRIIDCNKAFSEITGIKKELAVGHLATEVYQAETAPYLHEFTQVGITGVPFQYNTYYAPMDKHFLISVVSPQKNEFATITTDITAITQIQKVIETKNKELENYLYVASHDLRSPLVNIQGFSQRLQKQTDTIQDLLNGSGLEAEVKSKIETITLEGIPKSMGYIFTNVAKMDSLINGLLQISRTGRIVMDITQINVSELINKVLASLQYQITEVNAHVTLLKLPDCFGDENMLNQLFSNLISNAIKYRDRNRTLEITIQGKTVYNKVIYSISDTGIGIAPQYRDKIWDVFYRVDATAGQVGEGLGLSIAKRIIEKHKGRIWVESEEEKGSTFFIELQKNKFEE